MVPQPSNRHRHELPVQPEVYPPGPGGQELPRRERPPTQDLGFRSHARHLRERVLQGYDSIKIVATLAIMI